MGIKGAILGDIIGSKYEFTGCPNPDTCTLIDNSHFFTDDTILSVAVKWALDNNRSFADSYKLFTNYYKTYTYAGWGSNFYNWAFDSGEHRQSIGNGSAMRVGYVSDFCTNEEDVINTAKKSASPTHNTVEGITGAVATAVVSFLAKDCNKGFLLEKMRDYYGNIVDKTLEEYRKNYRWSELCKDSVPLAFRCFYESTDFSSCMRNVLSIYCDSDTIGAIAGNMAESYYGCEDDPFLVEWGHYIYVVDPFLSFVLVD